MITLLTGDNTFEIEKTLDGLVTQFNGDIEKFDGETLRLNQLPDIVMGGNLFAQNRMIIIRGLSDNKTVWSLLSEWLERLSDDTSLILVEPKLDKRTAIYKILQKIANVHEFTAWNARDNLVAEKWLIAEAKRQNLDFDKKSAQLLISMIGLDQWQLFHAIEKLAILGNASPETIHEVIDANPQNNAFNLLEIATRGDNKVLRAKIDSLKLTEDSYRFFGLLVSQVLQLANIINAEKGNNPSRDFGIHPFVVSKMSPLAKKLGREKVAKIIDIFTEADINLKTSATEPWLIIENALFKLANISRTSKDGS